MSDTNVKYKIDYSVNALTPPGQERPSFKPTIKAKDKPMTTAELGEYSSEHGYFTGSTKPVAVSSLTSGIIAQTLAEMKAGKSVNLGGFLHGKLVLTGQTDSAGNLTEANELKVSFSTGEKFGLKRSDYAFSRIPGPLTGATLTGFKDATTDDAQTTPFGGTTPISVKGRNLAKVVKDNVRILRCNPETGAVLETAEVSGTVIADTNGEWISFPAGINPASTTEKADWIAANCRLVIGTVGTDGGFYTIGKAVAFNYVKGMPLITSISQEGVEAANTVTFLDIDHTVTITGQNLADVTTDMVQLVIRNKTTGEEMERCNLDTTVRFTNTDTTITVTGGVTPDDCDIPDGDHCTNRAFFVINLPDGTVYEYEFHYQE